MQEKTIETLAVELDQFFLVVCGMFVLFMQAGFAFLEAGSVRSKNTTNIIMKNVLDVFIGAITYFGVGYSFAYGEPGNGFIGHNHFFGSNVAENATTLRFVQSPESYFAGWFYQFVFAATASTIVSGAMAERTEFTTYMIYCVFLTGFIYPVVSHWAWSDGGWLRTGAGIPNLAYIDFAGSGVVHVLGGTAALVGASFLGPRIGRFNSDGSYNDIPGHSTTVASLGGFILFVGFLAFNGGSQLSISNPGDGLALSIAVMSTVLGGSTSAMITMLLYKVTDAIRGQDHYWSLIVTINGGLAGMVSMCAGCNQYDPWYAILVGVFAGAAFIGWHHLTLKLKIDDPLDAVAVHLGGGLTGVILAPIFVKNGLQENGKYVGGIVYGGHSLAFRSFGWNLLAALVIMIWTGACCTIMFGSMKFLRILRVSRDVEIAGLDAIKHGEPAYPVKGYTDGELPFQGTNHDNFQKTGYDNSITLENVVSSQDPAYITPPQEQSSSM